MRYQQQTYVKETTWRVFLGNKVQTTQERQQLAEALKLHPATIVRWIRNQATPSFETLRALMALFPADQAYLLMLITAEFPTFSAYEKVNAVSKEIPSEVYAQVLAMMVQLVHWQEPWKPRDFVLRHALELLEPYEHDTMLMLSLCTTPLFGEKVRSLRSVLCAGYPPDGYSLHQKWLMGAESLNGYVATSGHPAIIHDTREARLLPLPKWVAHRSILIFPLRQVDHIAGTLMVASCRPHALVGCEKLVEEYTSLLTITCGSKDFYGPQQIALESMPALSVQAPYMDSFLQRNMYLYRQRDKLSSPLTPAQIEQLAWRQIEDDLIKEVLAPHGFQKSS